MSYTSKLLLFRRVSSTDSCHFDVKKMLHLDVGLLFQTLNYPVARESENDHHSCPVDFVVLGEQNWSSTRA